MTFLGFPLLFIAFIIADVGLLVLLSARPLALTDAIFIGLHSLTFSTAITLLLIRARGRA